MKISAFPKCWIEDICERRMPLLRWVDMATQLACEGLELYTGFLERHDADDLAALRHEIEKREMVVSMMCHSPDFTVPRSQLAAQIDAQCEMIRVTAALGGGYCRTLSGQNRPGLDHEAAVKQVAEAIQACLGAAEKHKVVLAMENHFKDGYWKYPEFAQKQEVFFDIVGRIDSPWFGIQYDPSNALVAGEDPVALLDRALPRVKTMHASDRYLRQGSNWEDAILSIVQTGYPENLLHGVVGKGLNNYPLIFEKLSDAGYDGWVSIEDGINGMEEMKESVVFLKKMRDTYFQK